MRILKVLFFFIIAGLIWAEISILYLSTEVVDFFLRGKFLVGFIQIGIALGVGIFFGHAFSRTVRIYEKIKKKKMMRYYEETKS